MNNKVITLDDHRRERKSRLDDLIQEEVQRRLKLRKTDYSGMTAQGVIKDIETARHPDRQASHSVYNTPQSRFKSTFPG